MAGGSNPKDSGGKKPTPPTIGTATAGNAQATVTFTASTYRGKSGTVTYRVTSNPGSITATGAGTPIVVTGLTNGTSYTFTVRAETPSGVNSDSSAATSAVTPVAPPFFPPFFPFFPPFFPPYFPPPGGPF